MKKITTITALLLILSMTAGMAAGCGKDKETSAALGSLPIITDATKASHPIITDGTQVTLPVITEQTTSVAGQEVMKEYKNAAYQLRINIPEDFSAIESDAEHVRFQSDKRDTSITLLAAVGGTMGVLDQQELKNLFRLRSKLLRLRIAGEEYQLFGYEIQSIQDNILAGGTTVYRDILATSYYDSASMSKEQTPFTQAYYFIYDKNAYVLVIDCPKEESTAWDATGKAMINSLVYDTSIGSDTALSASDLAYFVDEKAGVKFAYPRMWNKQTGSDRTVIRSNTIDPADPYFGLQITCFPGSATFTDDYLCIDQLQGIIGASYGTAYPLEKAEDVTTTIKNVSTGNETLFDGNYVMYYDLVTSVLANKSGLGDFVDGGNINSRILTFTTDKGTPYAINVSWPASGAAKGTEIIGYIKDTLEK